MSGLVALSLSIGVLGGVATWLAFGPLAGMVTIWGIFIAWGSYFHNGADDAALKNTIVCGIFGSVMAGIAFILMAAVPLGDLLNAPVWVAVTVFVLVFGSQVPALSVIPTAVYGYAATAAYAIHVGGSATAMDFSNPVAVISLSIIVGTLFGLVSNKVSAMLAK
ncbi:MAG: DUF1097 domain-containing protein [Gammaproteobacteria bacterium]|nr:DUF1097 domain-containing protein [Gammaproteobacteria bacterium]MDH5591607.1 DUF1097 domain-containing protein [Gammaproteobacteria bacterium]